jgi:hypothetical protein
MLRVLRRLFGSGGPSGPERNDVWERLVADSEAGIAGARDAIARLVERAGGLSSAVPAAFFRPGEADPPFEEMISGAERELEELCGQYDYRQLLFLSRLCTGVPLLRDADADMAAVRVRVQNADRWVLRCGDRSLDHDYMSIGPQWPCCPTITCSPFPILVQRPHYATTSISVHSPRVSCTWRPLRYLYQRISDGKTRAINLPVQRSISWIDPSMPKGSLSYKRPSPFCSVL